MTHRHTPVCNFSVSSIHQGRVFFLPPCGRSCTVFMRLLHHQLSAVRIGFPPHPAVVLLRIEARGVWFVWFLLRWVLGWDLRWFYCPIKGWDMHGWVGEVLTFAEARTPIAKAIISVKKHWNTKKMARFSEAVTLFFKAPLGFSKGIPSSFGFSPSGRSAASFCESRDQFMHSVKPAMANSCRTMSDKLFTGCPPDLLRKRRPKKTRFLNGKFSRRQMGTMQLDGSDTSGFNTSWNMFIRLKKRK